MDSITSGTAKILEEEPREIFRACNFMEFEEGEESTNNWGLPLQMEELGKCKNGADGEDNETEAILTLES